MAFLGVGFGHRPYGSFRSESFAFVIPFNISYVGVIDSTSGSSYLVAHPLIGDQTLLALTTHVLQQAPNFAPTVASMGYRLNHSSLLQHLSLLLPPPSVRHSLLHAKLGESAHPNQQRVHTITITATTHTTALNAAT